MRYLLVGLMMSLAVSGLAYAGDAGASKYDVTGIPLYEGPMYRSLDSMPGDITMGPEFHSFHHRGVDEVGYSPLTLADFRFPVVKRTGEEFNFERLYYPDHAVTVWDDDCANFSVTAFFFTRDMVRDHIQRLIDEYYICDPAILQQVIDYYAEVTPQCGEAISWVWFRVDDKGHNYSDKVANRYFSRYLANFKDKFYLEFGVPKAQGYVDEGVRDFLYQYQDRGRYNCGPEFENKCETGCNEGQCSGNYECNTCPVPKNEPGDQAFECNDFNYKGFDLNVNNHYLYYPRKVVIEDLTYDPVAQAYRWKFAWRFNDCEVDWLRQICQYGKDAKFALVLSDPHWYAHADLNKGLERDLLAAMDPTTWGNVWPAGDLPFNDECCPCGMPSCPGNCMLAVAVGWEKPTPPPVVVTPEVPEPPVYVPPVEEEEEVIVVPGKG